MYSVTEEFVGWLAEVTGLHASTFPPETGAEFVTVERTGGGVDSFADHPLMAVQAWAQTEARAEAIASAIRDAALTGPWPHGVTAMRVNAGPYRWYDESTRLPRYQVVFDVTCISIE